MKLDLGGPTLEFLVPPRDGEPCLMRGVIPAGDIVPLHSHADPETFLMLEGEAEGLRDGRWVRVRPGDVFHVPGDTRHAWRNRSRGPAVMNLVTTSRMGRFLQEVAGTEPQEFLAISASYGYWNATPEENAAVGLQITASGDAGVSDAVPRHVRNDAPGR
jgi:quercetin dioxygenase-like cupin family protein